MTTIERNAIAKTSMALDRLQVELCPNSPYTQPTAKEIRDRILVAMSYLEPLNK